MFASVILAIARQADYLSSITESVSLLKLSCIETKRIDLSVLLISLGSLTSDPSVIFGACFNSRSKFVFLRFSLRKPSVWNSMPSVSLISFFSAA